METGYVDMALERKELGLGAPCVEPAQPTYPYGLCICLTTEELTKLNLDDDVQVGNMVRLNCIAKVTSASERDTTEGVQKRVELQIIAIEAEGEEEEPTAQPKPYEKMYNAG